MISLDIEFKSNFINILFTYWGVQREKETPSQDLGHNLSRNQELGAHLPEPRRQPWGDICRFILHTELMTMDWVGLSLLCAGWPK